MNGLCMPHNTAYSSMRLTVILHVSALMMYFSIMSDLQLLIIGPLSAAVNKARHGSTMSTFWVNFKCRQDKHSRGMGGPEKHCKEWQGTPAQAVLYLPPFSTLGALHPFLEGIPFLLLHGACERLAGEGLIITLFIHWLVCFIPILNALLLTASGNTINEVQLASSRSKHSYWFVSVAVTRRQMVQSRGFC